MHDESVYSTDVWDYLGDMSYMPSRQDRDQLVRAGEEKRVQIWDYFFRIQPGDVGKPQKKEIEGIKKQVIEKITQYIKEQADLNTKINASRRVLLIKQFKTFLWGLGGLLIAGIVYKTVWDFALLAKYGLICVAIPAFFSMVTWLGIAIVGRSEKSSIKNWRNELRLQRENHSVYIKDRIERKKFLRDAIKALIRKMPSPPPDMVVRQWLHQDFLSAWERSKQVTALGNRLVTIESGELDAQGKPLAYPNPIPVLGPGELQQSDRIPPTFTNNVNPDLYKHLLARRSFPLPDQDCLEVLYGVYYLEHVLVADNMLATYGLFFDFITAKYHAEQIAEQYYQDVVAISTTHEFRTITLSANAKETRYVEDAPTFTLSLASGEDRKVTFVSEKYYMEIREKLNLREEDVPKIYWIARSKMDANVAVKALRSRLQLHK